MTNNNQPLITPDIKIHEMLEAYPQLEDKLIEIAPVFVKLKNPVLRKTIAKVTTLKQAAIVGKIPIGELVNILRSAVNQGNAELAGERNLSSARPEWIDKGKIEIEYDAREDLENNVHPVNRVVKEIAGLNDNLIYVLITPFTPAPLIDMIVQKGYDVYSEERSPGAVFTYIKKQNPS